MSDQTFNLDKCFVCGKNVYIDTLDRYGLRILACLHCIEQLKINPNYPNLKEKQNNV